jgi:hypothetical protein
VVSLPQDAGWITELGLVVNRTRCQDLGLLVVSAHCLGDYKTVTVNYEAGVSCGVASLGSL